MKRWWCEAHISVILRRKNTHKNHWYTMCYRYAELTCFSFHLNIVYVYIKPQSVERFEIGNIHFYFHCAPHWSSITWCGKHRHYNFHKSHLCITINCLILIFEFNQPSIKRWIKMHAFEYTYSIIANL